jgi:phosphohistidine phosphatase
VADHDRNLSPAGESQAVEIGARLLRQKIRPDWILCSTAERARATAAILLGAGLPDAELKHSVRLYGAGPVVLMECFRDLPEALETVLVVAHNPGLEEFVHLLTGERPLLAPGTLAWVSVPVEIWGEMADEIQGRLMELWRPGATEAT